MKAFKYIELIEQIKQDFKIDYYGDHGINHWRRVYYTTPEKPNNFTENLIPKRVKLDDKYRGTKR